MAENGVPAFLSGVIVSLAIVVLLYHAFTPIRFSEASKPQQLTASNGSIFGRPTDGSSDSVANVKRPTIEYKKEVSIKRYKRIHQRLNKLREWEAYELSGPVSDEELPFNVYIRQNYIADTAGTPTDILVEIQCDELKKVLKSCLQYIDSVFDTRPMVRDCYFILIED